MHTYPARLYVCTLAYDDALLPVLRVCILPLSRVYFVSFEYFVDKMACVRAKHCVHHADCAQFSVEESKRRYQD